eukprot:7523111-Pyramimonas_sp.AAC.1
MPGYVVMHFHTWLFQPQTRGARGKQVSPMETTRWNLPNVMGKTPTMRSPSPRSRRALLSCACVPKMQNS